MAFDYKLVKKNEQTALTHYEVVETNTDQVIRKFSVDKQPEARAFMRSLNLGAGFNGFTPSFFLTEVQKHISSD